MGVGLHLLTTLAVLLIVVHYQCQGQVANNLGSYDAPHKRFEYKYSFKGPYLAQKDGAVPFWEYEGSAIASEDMVRITPSLRSKRGAIWSKVKTNFEWWEVELWVRVTGRGRLGADGIGFWFTENRTPEGPVFGSADQWRGLGIFFDSFDNDAKGNNPYVMAMINDGSKIYNHETDGSQQQVAGCLRDFRNKPFPVRAKIEYYRNVLTVMFHSGNSNNDDEYELCLRAENVVLPQFGYFGISAATGGLADDHDALKFLAYSVHVPGSQTGAPAAGQPAIGTQEKQRMDAQYDEFKTKLDKQKEEYFKTHPDEAKKFHDKEELSPEHEYESLGERELQQIFDGQSQMYEALKSLNRKLDEILGRQERTLSMIGTVGAGGGGAVPQQGGTGFVPASPIQRHEVESLLGATREVLQNSRDIRTSVLNNAGAGGGAVPVSQQAGQQANPMQTTLLTEIREGINVLRKEMTHVGQKVLERAQQAPLINCPATPSCASPTLLVILLGLHLVLTLGYLIFKGSRDSQSKKFY